MSQSLIVPRIVHVAMIVFAATLAFLYLRRPMMMWTRVLKPGFGGVVISERTGRRIASAMGWIAVAFTLVLVVFLLLSLSR